MQYDDEDDEYDYYNNDDYNNDDYNNDDYNNDDDDEDDDVYDLKQSKDAFESHTTRSQKGSRREGLIRGL